MILLTVCETFSARYSLGAVHAAGCEIASSTARTIASGSAPARILLPHSIVSGRSVTSRSVTFGMPKIAHSSCTVPLSVRTASEFFSSFTKSKKPSASSSRILRSGFDPELLAAFQRSADERSRERPFRISRQ